MCIYCELYSVGERRRVNAQPCVLYGEKYDPMLMYDSKRDVANLLHEEAEARYVREFIRRKQQQQAQQKQNKKNNRDSWER